jgi:hypothetical protein
VCTYCRNHTPRREYLGADALKRRILSNRARFRNSKYDCAVGFSGGRDSTYLLFLLKEKLNLNVLAYTMDNGFVPPACMENIRAIASNLGVDLVVKRHSYLEDCFGDHLRAWLRRPDPAMITALCTGCRLGLAEGMYQVIMEHEVPAYVSGVTPFEAGDYKTALLRVPSESKGVLAFVCGYANQVIRNPRWISRPRSVAIQAREFVVYNRRNFRRKAHKKGHDFIGPFYRYIKWDEKELTRVLNDIGWQQNRDTGSTWRGDCEIATLKLYLYHALLGYNDKDDALSALIRDGQLTREEATRRLEAEQYISDDAIEALVDRVGVPYDEFRRAVDDARVRSAH